MNFSFRGFIPLRNFFRLMSAVKEFRKMKVDRFVKRFVLGGKVDVFIVTVICNDRMTSRADKVLLQLGPRSICVILLDDILLI